METVYVDHEEKRLIGPMSLVRALAAAEPDPNGIRIAVSAPDGAYVAVSVPIAGEPHVVVRQVATITGHGGTELGTGAWKNPARGDHYPRQWRPA